MGVNYFSCVDRETFISDEDVEDFSIEVLCLATTLFGDGEGVGGVAE